ncbi:hypothetical protein F385_934 [Pantoea agglomerans 299R]|nr:hypothetical protein F385_934 [Pantoea agglomerans 299R]
MILPHPLKQSTAATTTPAFKNAFTTDTRYELPLRTSRAAHGDCQQTIYQRIAVLIP